MLFTLLVLTLAQRSSEEVFVFLVGEVDIVIPVWVRVLGWVKSVILPSGAGVQGCTVVPCLELEVAYRPAAVVVTHLHGTLVSLVVDGLRS